MNIRRYKPSDRDAVIRLAARMNSKGETHIAYFDGSEETMVAYLDGLSPSPEEGFVVAYAGDTLIGCFGLEYDDEQNRTWLHGPVVDSPAWHTIADALYEAALAILPARIDDLELAFDLRHYRGIDFARRHGFEGWKAGSAVLVYTREQFARITPRPCEGLQDAHHAAFMELHDLAFPNTYYTGKQMLDMRDDTYALLAETRDGSFAGSAFVEMQSPETGFIHFLATVPTLRGKGVGKALLEQAVHWVFAHTEAKDLALTVEVGNPTAIRLYERTGFVRERVIRGYRLQR